MGAPICSSRPLPQRPPERRGPSHRTWCLLASEGWYLILVSAAAGWSRPRANVLSVTRASTAPCVLPHVFALRATAPARGGYQSTVRVEWSIRWRRPVGRSRRDPNRLDPRHWDRALTLTTSGSSPVKDVAVMSTARVAPLASATPDGRRRRQCAGCALLDGRPSRRCRSPVCAPALWASVLETDPMSSRGNRLASGFTLIELMIVVAVVAILASIAYPSLPGIRAQGASRQAKADLLEYAQLAERFHTVNNTYVNFTLPTTQSPREGGTGVLHLGALQPSAVHLRNHCDRPRAAELGQVRKPEHQSGRRQGQHGGEHLPAAG